LIEIRYQFWHKSEDAEKHGKWGEVKVATHVVFSNGSMREFKVYKEDDKLNLNLK